MLEFAQVREDYIADNSQVREDKQYIKDLGNGRPAQARRAEESGVGGWGHSRHHLGDLRCWKGHCHERRSWTWSCNRQWVSFLLKQAQPELKVVREPHLGRNRMARMESESLDSEKNRQQSVPLMPMMSPT